MAFWKGIVIGGLAGAAYGLLNAERSGALTRAKIVEEAEEVLFKITGMDVWTPEQNPPDPWTPGTVENPAEWTGEGAKS